QVADRLQADDVGALEDDEEVLALGESREPRRSGLGRRRVTGDDRPDDVDPAGSRPVGGGTAQGRDLHLPGSDLAVVARLRAVDDATTGELRRPDRALTRAAGALLTVRLGATASDLGAGLGLVGARTRRGELRGDDLVDQRDVGLDVEDLRGEVDV